MLDCKAAARLPESLPFFRNGRSLVAKRVVVGEIEVAGGQLKIADALCGDAAAPIPLRIPNGRHAVYAYEWDHPRGPIKVCAVLAFSKQRLATARPLTITNETRPDLTSGIIVDSAEVRIGGASHIVLTSGLGDGYYPVFGVFNFAFFTQAVVLDFRMDHAPRFILLPGQVLDEFGIVQHLNQDS